MTNAMMHKRAMLGDLKNLVSNEKDLNNTVWISRQTSNELVKTGTAIWIMQKVGNRILLIRTYNLAFLEVKPCQFKVIEMDMKLIHFLAKTKWRYYGGNVVGVYQGVSYRLEEVALNCYKKQLPYLKMKDVDIHHKHLRSIVIRGSVMALSKKNHDETHKVIGRYSHRDCIILNNVIDVERFVKKIMKDQPALLQKEFDILI